MNANGRVISIFLMQEAPPQEPTPVPGTTATPPPKPKEDHWWQLGSWGLGGLGKDWVVQLQKYIYGNEIGIAVFL